MSRREQGVTLIEVLVSILIIGLIVTAVLATMSSAFKLNSDAELTTQAAYLAQGKMDELRLRDPREDALWPGGQEENSTVVSNNRNFELRVQHCVTAAYCQNGSRDVKIEVRSGPRLLFSGETVFTRLEDSR